MGNTGSMAVHPSQLSRRLSLTSTRKAEDKSILLLGLDGSGKSALVYGLASIPNATATAAQPSSWTPPLPSPTKVACVKTTVIHGRMFKLVDMPGHRDARHLWYQHTTDVAAVCFCIDMSDVLRFPLVAKELDRLATLTASLASSPVVWLLFTKADCASPGQRLNAIDTYEAIKKCHLFQTRRSCDWSFILAPSINCLAEMQLSAFKLWVHEHLAMKG
ncbi:hypothetical protein SPRG_10026 [Saprolegnia parasitica CBS 223.65]|uniref:Signal recognition particle receptor subunit beta n=1 Tax=Saprolegnia parasitica (strain CBS 223.65) TaxID=695850 RepID=A0A067CBG8_SAPPC|nr:hypothetical protein SPRG_10026 [Saprolegnia parasitica CBS 223.65]KDO23881.1 hypothetical protein SPRG_10026 [Saprolegnia parasitica CBS 223.65]|eukprot:XP_012205351.1 hypothetical protein SPRG_10026 [Saprolegnia parasitica CBS 223.65]